jgi:uncharacterized RDD family membrane protein YckC
MSTSPQDIRYAPPQTTVDDVAPSVDGLQLASRTRRFMAAVIDTLAQALAMWLASLVTPWDPWAGDNADFWVVNLTGAVAGFAIFLVLQAYLLVTRGQTIGKAVLGLRITRPDGARVSAGRVIGLRYGVEQIFSPVAGAAIAFAVLDALFIFRKSRRCLHDLIADTIVIRV